ncbi:MAG: AAA family ATPase [Chloroflexi bacterium]|nr:AAA family ATPase [Chloroflexota bacterium]
MDRERGHRSGTTLARKPFGSRALSPFVGRDGELRNLRMALAQAADGEGGLIFLTGQPGIGKTRLAREALRAARQLGFVSLEGRAYPVEAGLAYAPVLDAFGPLLLNAEPARLATLISGLPDLARLFGVLQLPPPAPLGDPALEKTRLFDAVSHLLQRLTIDAPVVLLMDDMQWADPASLELLHYLARGLSSQRALLLTTYSVDASDVSGNLRAVVASLQRDGLAGEIVLQRLSRGAVGDLARGILGDEPPSDLLALLEARAGGTPLFVEALINALIDSGYLVRDGHSWVLGQNGAAALPPSVRRLILQRLDRLPQADRRLLDLVAVMGDATPHSVLRKVSAMGEETLLASLRQLLAAGLIAERMDGSDVIYNITHPLIQEVAYAELPEAARRRAHLSAVQAMESSSRGRPEDLNRLARHYHNAGPDADRSRALAALVAAGERALVLYANEEAVRHFEAALAMIRECGPDFCSTLSYLLEQLGEARERTGRRDAAVELWNEALALLSQGRERSGLSEERIAAVSRLRSRLALAEWDRGRFDLANMHLKKGLEALAGRNPSHELSNLQFTQFQILIRAGDAAGAGYAAAALLSTASRLSSPHAEAEANLAAASICLDSGDIATARERALHALELGESFPGGQGLAICSRAHIHLVAIGMRLGDHHFMRDHAERGLALARRIGAPSFEVLQRHRLAFASFLSGAWSESLNCCVEAIALARRVGHPRDLARSLAERAVLLALQGNLPMAEASISESRAAFGGGAPVDRGVYGLIDIVEVCLALERGQIDRAVGIAKGFASLPKASAEPAGLSITYMPTGLTLLAEVQAAAKDGEGALETARQIIGLGPIGTPYLTALATRAEGLGREAMGQREAGISCLTRAHEMFSALEMPFEAARALLEQAIRLCSTKPKLSVKYAQQSLATFERLDAQRFADRARRLLRGLGITPVATCRSRLGGFPVSERELEIALLVARGSTTAEIAKRLTVSPLTITSHLHRIYTRLGVSSRIALARCVIEAGLLRSEDQNT